MTRRKDLKPTVGTWARTICLMVAIINQILAAQGRPILPIDNETITSLITAAAALAAWWKNNSFSCAALNGDEVKKMLQKEGC